MSARHCGAWSTSSNVSTAAPTSTAMTVPTEMAGRLKSPYPYFGGKSSVADVIWAAFGQVENYIEPFFGSGAVLLGRPGWTEQKQWSEIVNDKDGFVCNFWRALRADPAAVAQHADYPIIEQDLEARHLWLVQQRRELYDKLGDPDFFDAKIAGWWVWGLSCWIGGGWCAGDGPWVLDAQKRIVKSLKIKSAGGGISRRHPVLSCNQGIHRKRVFLDHEVGVNRRFPPVNGLSNYLRELSHRMRRVKVCGGDWGRVCTPCVVGTGLTAIFFDPPYTADAGRDPEIYAVEDLSVGHAVAQWCAAQTDNKNLRLALCGYEGEYALPGWRCHTWQAQGGHANRAAAGASNNRHRERIWFSPSCYDPELDLFARSRGG